MLSLLSKNQVKYFRSLKLSKFRQMYNNFIVEGEKIVLELLQDVHIEIESLICTKEWYDVNAEKLVGFEPKICLAKAKEMDQITALKTAGKVIAVVKQPEQKVDSATLSNTLGLYLNGIQNPGNFGTILRIADWFGITTVYYSSDSADLYNPKVIQATMGAFLRVRVIKSDFMELIQDPPQFPVYGTVLEGNNLFETTLDPKGLIVIGSEGKGISPEILPHISHPITIPAHPNGGAESLNAAVATGIVCAQFRNGGV